MTAVTDEVIADIRDRLVRAADPWLLVLFGSRARGSARADSDVDLLIVEDAPFGPDRSRVGEYGRLSDALWGVRVPVDLVIVSREEFAMWRDSRTHVIAEALRDGRVLHARAA